MKTRIYAAPAVKGLNTDLCVALTDKKCRNRDNNSHWISPWNYMQLDRYEWYMHILSWAGVTVETPTTTLLCKVKRQHLLTCKVSRYCLLALHGSAVHDRMRRLNNSSTYSLVGHTRLPPAYHVTSQEIYLAIMYLHLARFALLPPIHCIMSHPVMYEYDINPLTAGAAYIRVFIFY